MNEAQNGLKEEVFFHLKPWEDIYEAPAWNLCTTAQFYKHKKTKQLWDKQRGECGLAWFLKKPQVQNTVSITDGFWVIHRGAKIEMQITDYNVLAAFAQNRFRVYMSFPVVEFFWTGMRNVGKTVFNVVNFPKWRYLNQQVNNSCFYDSLLPFRLDACLT